MSKPYQFIPVYLQLRCGCRFFVSEKLDPFLRSSNLSLSTSYNSPVYYFLQRKTRFIPKAYPSIAVIFQRLVSYNNFHEENVSPF